MKAFLLLFIFHYVLSEHRSYGVDFPARPYPNKVLRRDLLILNSKIQMPANTKKPNVYKGYTAFAPIDKRRPETYMAPDSPYFQLEHDVQPKSRVKKVLPSYWSSRVKRSVGIILKPDNIKVNKNVTMKKVTKIAKPIKAKSVKNKKTLNGTKTVLEDKTIKAGGEIKKRFARSHHSHAKKHHKRSRAQKSKKKHRSKRGGHKKKSKRSRSKHHKAGKKEVPSRRLIASKDANIEDYPYTVSIQKHGEHWCSGAILNPRLVITTANCIWKSEHASRLRIRAGSRNPYHGGQTAKIAQVMKHPSWSIRRLPDNDIGLLLLDRNLKYTNCFIWYTSVLRFSDSVHGVDLPNHAMLPAFEDAWVTSWGAERRDGVYEDVSQALQAYHAQVLEHDQCNNVTSRFGLALSENFICLSQNGRRSPCTRDTGAPAVSDGILWGLASWGIRRLCGTERFPAMFSYVGSTSNMNFITNATHYLMSEKRNNPFLDAYPRGEVFLTSTVGLPELP